MVPFGNEPIKPSQWYYNVVLNEDVLSETFFIGGIQVAEYRVSKITTESEKDGNRALC